jgi:Meiotically up-regulated gene 113
MAAAAEIDVKLQEIGQAIAGVEAREANIRAGYVYVISNIGAFGPRMVKIGMTRRLDPEDRVRELGDASVPFRFDTHALIFSEDAVGLETKLHAALSEQRVNKVNLRREFFYADAARVRDLLHQIAGQHLLEYHDIPEALEWRASGAHPQHTQSTFEPHAA